MSAYNLVFWQNIPSPHQMPVLRELAKMGHGVVLVVDQLELEERKNMGWKMPDTTGVSVLEAKNICIDEYISAQSKDTVNISSGTRGCMSGLKVMLACKKHERRLGFIAEPGDPRGISGVLRKLIYVRDALRYSKYVDFIFAMGQTGMNWYLKSGYSKSKVFPYCYVVDQPTPKSAQTQNDLFRICFVGSLVQLKRVDLLVDAVKRLKDSCKLIVVGDGPDKAKLMTQASNIGVDQCIEWLDYQPHSLAMEHINHSDLLVLPSEYDGWGAVVNEALMLGVPVVCSDACGASDLFAGSTDIGLVFKSGSVDSLYNALQKMLDRGRLDLSRREQIKDWSINISGSAIACYFTDLLNSLYLDSKTPVPPWRSTL